MVTITICCQHCGSEDLVRNGYAPNENKDIAANHVRDKVVKILHPQEGSWYWHSLLTATQKRLEMKIT